MSISDDYFRYLDHFGPATTVRDFASRPSEPNLVALRHDVDHDLDLALEMSFWESRRGVRSTYYLLDSAPYWADPDLLAKCRQLVAFGHEVGLHVNALAKWVGGQVQDVKADLQGSLDRLRDGGAPVDTVSPHGDPLCYERGFINYWCFSELRPPAPEAVESGRSAEGIPVEGKAWQITYPDSEVLTRTDGASFALWSVSMASLGLRFDAMHVPFDRYFSDSGGWWTRSPDPLECNLRAGRHQVLMHAEHWRGPQRLYFFLSTPRSGSSWLAEVLEKATPLKGHHEFTLNHRYRAGQLTFDKRTLDDTNVLLADPKLTRGLLRETRSWVEKVGRDWGEANVYLHLFLPLLDEVFPDATLVHLHRHPADVVRSLVNRDWYDTPEDDRHPRLDVEGWAAMGQFEKACWFVRWSNDLLLEKVRARLAFDTMVNDPGRFAAELERLGIAVYPLLAAPLYGQRRNPSRSYQFPPLAEWPARERGVFARVCGPTCRALGYAEAGDAVEAPVSGAPSARPAIPRDQPRHKLLGRLKAVAALIPEGWLSASWWWARTVGPLGRERAQAATGEEGAFGRLLGLGVRGRAGVVWRSGCSLAVDRGDLKIVGRDQANACVVLGGATWTHCDAEGGWPVSLSHWYRGSAEVALVDDAELTVFGILYGESGDVVERRRLGRLKAGRGRRRFAFKSRPRARRLALAFYVPAGKGPQEVRIREVSLEEVSPVAA